MNDRLKNIIFKKLYEDLSHVEIIPHNKSIWFIDRDKKHWYFEYEKSGILWWRYDFFKNFFNLFSLERNEYEPIISEWVEEVLNCKVNTPQRLNTRQKEAVEEVLNCKVNTPKKSKQEILFVVEEVLNCKVNTPLFVTTTYDSRVEEVLNCKVVTTARAFGPNTTQVEEVLNCKVVTTVFYRYTKR